MKYFEFSNTPQIDVMNVTRQFLGVAALSNISLRVQAGKLTVITGQSGSGKTTMLNIMSGIDTPDEGTVMVGESDITKLSKKGREQFRAKTGQVFQRSGLLRGLTGEQNIRIPHDVIGTKIDDEWVQSLVCRLGIQDIIKMPAAQLSGGQAQRVGIARALAHRPSLIFADEPTASLDTLAKEEIHEILRDTAGHGATVVMVSHDDISRQYADVVLEMKDGMLTNDPV